MHVVRESPLHCPRCAYDLRGQTSPRCPECGLSFSDGQWSSGLLREHASTSLDRTDLWQPQLVIVHSLAVWLFGLLRPAWFTRRLDLEGRIAPAIVALVCGLLWNALLIIVVLAPAVYSQARVSPAEALQSATLTTVYWLPPAILRVLCLSGMIATRASLRVVSVTPRAVLRLLGYWLPIALAYDVLSRALVLAIDADSEAKLGWACCTIAGLVVLWRSAMRLPTGWQERVFAFTCAVLWLIMVSMELSVTAT